MVFNNRYEAVPCKVQIEVRIFATLLKFI